MAIAFGIGDVVYCDSQVFSGCDVGSANDRGRGITCHLGNDCGRGGCSQVDGEFVGGDVGGSVAGGVRHPCGDRVDLLNQRIAARDGQTPGVIAAVIS